MRYVRFLLVPLDGTLHPVEEELQTAGLEMVAIHHFRMLDDGTAVTFHEVEGDREAAEGVVEDHPSVLSYDITTDGETLFSHTRFEPNDLTASVYGIAQRLDLVLDMPMRYTDRNALRITAIGEFDTFQRAMGEMPDGVDLRLLKTGEYSPDGGELYSQLTRRQQETLRAAVEAGYYEEPREVTYDEVAEEMDIAPGTVGEHLRKIESQVLKGIVP